MFSPYYFKARRAAPAANPDNYCAVNVALYGGGAKRWTMTERGAGDMRRDASNLAIAGSMLAAGQSELTFAIDERTPMLGSQVKGSITVKPEALTDFKVVMDEKERHFWRPVSPRVHVEANFQKPGISWSGVGYLDMNWGSEPLETGFAHWNWSRAALKHDTAILYDLTRRDGTPLSLCLHIGADGSAGERDLPQSRSLSRTPVWGMARRTRCDRGGDANALKTLEDTPFYSRSMISTSVFGERAIGMHESLSLDRFRTPVVQTMLPYRMPRRAKED